jgi:hypothetical protein
MYLESWLMVRWLTWTDRFFGRRNTKLESPSGLTRCKFKLTPQYYKALCKCNK